MRGRDGESGTSKLTEMKTPLTWSSSPFGDSRFDFTVTPISLNAGTASGDAWRRYGANPLSNAVSNMISTATSEQAAIAAMTETERTAYFASNPGAEALSSLGTLNAADFNATTSAGWRIWRNLAPMTPDRSPAIWLPPARNRMSIRPAVRRIRRRQMASN